MALFIDMNLLGSFTGTSFLTTLQPTTCVPLEIMRSTEKSVKPKVMLIKWTLQHPSLDPSLEQ